jgi:putative FmdB family regulatory protein
VEVFQSMSDAPLRTCSECGGDLRKLLYPVGVQFKGSGFYTTDYRNGGRAKAESKAEAGGGESSAGSESKSEARSEAKSESRSESRSSTKSERAPAGGD